MYIYASSYTFSALSVSYFENWFL